MIYSIDRYLCFTIKKLVKNRIFEIHSNEIKKSSPATFQKIYGKPFTKSEYIVYGIWYCIWYLLSLGDEFRW